MEAIGASEDLLVVKLDVTDPADAEAAVKAAVDRFWQHRCAREQCG
jgi:NAD(P)-dependent dehydrogenase (short-subunit alcohol dehydrogenase family)